MGTIEKEPENEEEKEMYEIHRMLNTLFQLFSPRLLIIPVSSIVALFRKTPGLQRYFKILETNGVIKKKRGAIFTEKG